MYSSINRDTSIVLIHQMAPTKWTMWVKAEAARLKIPYGCAMGLPEVREGYKKSKEAKETKKEEPQKDFKEKIAKFEEDLNIKVEDKTPKVKKRGGLIGPQIRRDYAPQIRELLKKVGDKKITDITIQRVPIESVLKSVIDIITLGQYSKQTKKLGYDKVFHLSMIVTLEGGKRLVVEKNEVINISPKIPPMKKGGAQMKVPISQEITLNQLLSNAQEKMGSRFFIYHPFTANCQMFIDSLLTHSNLNTPEVKAFILQDAQAILKGLPIYSSAALKGITDLGAQFNRIIYGRGKK